MSTDLDTDVSHVRFSHTDPGTDESRWQSLIEDASLTPLATDYARVVVLAAHPDDETLGAGGLLARADVAGVPITIIVATDGEGSHPGDDGILTRRRGELDAALDEIAPHAEVRLLHLPDGRVREYRAALTEMVAAALQPADFAVGERVLLAAPWWGDGHRDHRIVGEVARSFASPLIDVVGYPVWFWHWGDPRTVETSTWRVLALSEHNQRAKASAIAHLTSQTTGAEPILHAGMRAHFARDVEIFIAANDVDAMASHPPPHSDFEAFHRRHDDPWGLASRPYEDRKRAILLASLPRDRFDRGLEIGCAHGVLTELLALRCSELVGVDLSPTAVTRARERVGINDRVQLREADVREDWPDGRFDLIVLSELAYYWSADEFAAIIPRILASLVPGGCVVLCHWRHEIAGIPSDGDRVHAQFAETSKLARIVEHREADFLLEIFASPDETSGDSRD